MEPEIKIRGYHTDSYQHVNNARYVEFLEEGRWQLLDDYIDLEAFMNQGYSFFVVNMNISYLSQARVNDVVLIKSGLQKMGNKSAVMKQQVINKANGKICIDADITFVIAGKDGKPIVLEDEVKNKIEQIPLFKD